MPKHRLLRICFRIVSVRAMATSTFTAISAFQMILFGENAKPLFRPIKITFFNLDYLFHGSSLHFGTTINLIDFC